MATFTNDDASASAQGQGVPPVNVLHDADGVLAVDKPAGLLLHRSALDAHETDDLVSRLRRQLQAPVWPAHRLDKGSSGLVLLARDATTAQALAAAFAGRMVHKRYLVLVRGWPAERGTISQPLARDPERPSAGQPRLPAVTHWQLLARHELPVCTHPAWPGTRVALLAACPETGRRHQLRRHFKHIGHPLIGDATHGKGPLNRLLAAHLGCQRLWLHAEQLELPHPASGQPLRLRAEPGAEWARWLAA